MSPTPFLPLCMSISEFVCADGDVRLVDGEYGSDGRLEVCFDQRFGSVCDSGFGQAEAAVVCRQLQYDDGEGGEMCVSDVRIPSSCC